MIIKDNIIKFFPQDNTNIKNFYFGIENLTSGF